MGINMIELYKISHIIWKTNERKMQTWWRRAQLSGITEKLDETSGPGRQNCTFNKGLKFAEKQLMEEYSVKMPAN